MTQVESLYGRTSKGLHTPNFGNHELICNLRVINPSYFDYRYDSDAFASISVAELWAPDDDQTFLREVNKAVNYPCTGEFETHPSSL